MEVACGNNHSAILEALEPVNEKLILTKSRLLTCGNGASGQLGHEELSGPSKRSLEEVFERL